MHGNSWHFATLDSRVLNQVLNQDWYIKKFTCMYTHRYAIGGYYYPSARNNVERITKNGGSWQTMASFPRNIHRQFLWSEYDEWLCSDQCKWSVRQVMVYDHKENRHCTAVDEGFDRIYVLGGHDSSYNRREVYYYTVSANTWTYHRCFSMQDAANFCGIIFNGR